MAKQDCKECGGAGLIFYEEIEQVPVYPPMLIRVAKQGWPRQTSKDPNPSDVALVEEIRDKLRKGESLNATKPGPVPKTKHCQCVLVERIKSCLGDYTKVKHAVPREFYTAAWHGSVLVVDELDWFKSAVHRVLLEMIAESAGKSWPKYLSTTPYDIMTRRARPDYHADEGDDPFDRLRRKDGVDILIVNLIDDPPGNKYADYLYAVVHYRKAHGLTTWVFVDDGLGFDAGSRNRFVDVYGVETVELLKGLTRIEIPK